MINLLVVAPVPFNKHSQSRALISYFGKLAETENVFQIFFNPNQPEKSFYKGLFQITDEMLLDARLHSIKDASIGNIFSCNASLADSTISKSDFIPSLQSVQKYSNLKKIKNHKGALVILLRNYLWKSKYWEKNEKLKNWVNENPPSAVYCCFSDDPFVLKMALFFAKMYDVPLISQISDDYFFNGHFSLSPFYLLYRHNYKKLVKHVLSYKGSSFYLCNKAKQKYDAYFHNMSDVFYISSSFLPSTNRHQIGGKIIYAGDLGLGRYKALIEISNALQLLDKKLYIDIFSGVSDQHIINVISKCPGILFHGAVSYEKIISNMTTSNLVLVVENKQKKFVKKTQFSLSTKVADSLALGIPIFSYGSLESGSIEYLYENQAACCCFTRQSLVELLEKALWDGDFRKRISGNAIELSQKNHNQEKTSKMFFDFVKRTIEK